MKKKDNQPTSCEMCAHFVYDELYGEYICQINLDEDEMSRFLSSKVIFILSAEAVAESPETVIPNAFSTENAFERFEIVVWLSGCEKLISTVSSVPAS